MCFATFSYFCTKSANRDKEMTNIATNITGSWKANRDQQLYANSFVKCEDILTLDNDGRMFRQLKTTNYVFKNDGSKDEFVINVTLVGTYEVKDDLIFFKNAAPRLDENSFNYFPSEKDDKKMIDEKLVIACGKAQLENKIADVLMNRAIECRRGNEGQLPNCHFSIKGKKLVMKWEGFEREDVMSKCSEPKDLDRDREPMAVEEALAAPETKFVNAVFEGDCDYLNNVVLYTPCETNNNGKELDVQFNHFEINGKKYLVTFTDMPHFHTSALQTDSNCKPTRLVELAEMRNSFDGLCINPYKDSSIGITSQMLDAFVNRTWKGMPEQ